MDDYTDWINIGMALKNYYGEDTNAFNLWKYISNKSDKYLSKKVNEVYIEIDEEEADQNL